STEAMLGGVGLFSSFTLTRKTTASPAAGAFVEYSSRLMCGGMLPPGPLAAPRQSRTLTLSPQLVAVVTQEPNVDVPGGLKTKVESTSSTGTGAGPAPSGKRPKETSA